MNAVDLLTDPDESPFFLISGPCVIESEAVVMEIAATMAEITRELGIPYLFKASFDKANRTSGSAFRGLGRSQGLDLLVKVRETLGIPVLTDVHSVEDVEAASKAVDFLQTPAFLCRQTDLISAAAESGLPVNIKKGQFLSPQEMTPVVNKARDANPDATITVCERGASFGYNNLVVDMRSLEIMRDTGCPVVFDCTHSVQQPGAGGDRSGGQRQYVPVLSRAAVAAGVSGLFMETHPRPEQALSDGPNNWPLHRMRELLESLLEIDRVIKQQGVLAQASS